MPKLRLAEKVAFFTAIGLGLLLFISILLDKFQYNSADVLRKKVTSYAHLYTIDKKFVQLGMPMDCSAFTKAVYASVDIELPRSAREQYSASIKVYKPQPGDLVFWGENDAVSHVAIYLGNHTFIHSPRIGNEVRCDSISPKLKMKLIGFGSYIAN